MVVVVLGFYVPPTATVIRRRNLGLKSLRKDFCHGVIPVNDANGIANSEDPDQTAPLGAV